MKVRIQVCDSCLMAAEEEGVPEGDEAAIMREMGADIADHDCDERESDGDIQCSCACHPRVKKLSALSNPFNNSDTNKQDIIAHTYHQTHGKR